MEQHDVTNINAATKDIPRRPAEVLLLNPPMDFDVALGKARGIAKYTVMIPQGLASIAAVLEKNGVSCEILDAYAENLSIDAIVSEVLKRNPAALGITCVTPVMPIVYEIIRQVKKRAPSIITVLGGPHPSVMADHEIRNADIDFIVRGEGEFTFLGLLKCLSADGNFDAVNGISYRKAGAITHNKPAENINDPDLLPQPAYHLLPMHLYTAPPQWSIATPSYQMLASRGCPYQCSFCYVGMGRRVRYKSPRRVCDEIEYLIKNYGCRQIVFADTTFPFNGAHARAVCTEMINRGLNKKVVWFTSTRADIIDADMLALMYKAGCRLITLGVESGNQQILDSIKKNITLKQFGDAVKMAHKAKIGITASYIIGLPGETFQTATDTINFAKKLGTLYAQFNILVPYPGSEIYDRLVGNGKLRNKDWNNYVSLTSMTDLNPPFIPEGMTKEDLLALQRKAYNSYYFRPAILLKHLKRMLFNKEFAKYFSLLRVFVETFKKKRKSEG
ncbi:MAG: radical SAM protein [Endomicrobiia bacterium]|nr:radical SAM protein [Endomicrobiia bacterium]